MSDGMRVEVSLVLQGGGALGAYEWGAITALLDRMDAAERERGHTVVLTGVTGVSIGAVNAACLARTRSRPTTPKVCATSPPAPSRCAAWPDTASPRRSSPATSDPGVNDRALRP